MTHKERLLAMVGFQPGENAADAELLDLGVEPYTEYVSTSYPKIRIAAIRIIETLLSTPNSSNAVTGFSTTYDRGAIERRLAILKKEAGINQPTIKAISAW